ncbi:hypothetical protein ACLEDU_02480 [Lonsdalea quercina]|uniref:hypothetical protein n=1 Tax=Lonsdalea quercina TaxID=71657 RepID=UPI0039770618
MIFFSNFALRFRNARKVIKQIRSGEWSSTGIDSGNVYSACRDGREIWLSNGAFFCDLVDPSDRTTSLMAFGLVWRHWVWWAAARKLKGDIERKNRDKIHIPEL